MFDEKDYKAVFSKVTASDELRQKVFNLMNERRIDSRKLVVLVAVIGTFFLLACGMSFGGISMLDGIFGINGRQNFDAENYYIYYEDGYQQSVQAAKGERLEVDMELAARDIVPHVFAVDQCISDGNCIITAQYCLIDRSTKTGAVYLKIENPPYYQVSNSGKLLWINESEQWYPYLNFNPIGWDYFVGNERIAYGATTEDVLYLTYFFTCEESCAGMTITTDNNQEQIISIDFPSKTKFKTVSSEDDSVVISPFAMKLDTATFGINFMSDQEVLLNYDNGETYLVCRIKGAAMTTSYHEDIEQVNNTNGSFFLNTENTEEVIFFNRVVDTEHIKSIHVNGEELQFK